MDRDFIHGVIAATNLDMFEFFSLSQSKKLRTYWKKKKRYSSLSTPDITYNDISEWRQNPNGSDSDHWTKRNTK